jgi:hypothetical protein
VTAYVFTVKACNRHAVSKRRFKSVLISGVV